MKKLLSLVIAVAAVVAPGIVVAQDCGGCEGAAKGQQAKQEGCCPGEGAGKKDECGGGGCCEEMAATGLGALDGLCGEWVGADADKDGQPDVTVTYRKTAGGTAIVETLMPGTPKEMVTVYSRDGEGFVLTHFCAVGNQVRMRGKAGANPGEMVFEFVDGTNMKPTDAHMHTLVLTVVDATHIRHVWTMWKDGKAANTITFELTKRAPTAATGK